MFEDLLDEEEEFTDIEEAEGLSEPRFSETFLGHPEKEPYLLNLINQGNLPHALILSGPRGVGKSTFAFRLSRALLKKGIDDPNQDSMFGDMEPAEITTLDVDAEDPVFRKIASGGHPDFLALERPMDDRKNRRKDTLDVDTVRKAAPFLRMTSSEGGWRIVLIDDADTMNRNAQNAILKILEEPPKNTLLLLICHRVGAMIPTIRSRCRVLNFQPLAKENVLDLLKREYPGEPDHELNLIAIMAEGSIGRACELMEEEGAKGLQIILDTLNDWERWNWPEIHKMADTLGRPGQESAYNNFAQTLLWIMQALLFAKAKDEIMLEAPLDHKALRNMLSHYSLEEWAEICENLKVHFDTFAYSHLDKRQAVLGAFSLIK